MTGSTDQITTRNNPDVPEAQALLQLEQIDAYGFRSRHNQHNQAGSMFGGQLLAQGLAAAGHTVTAGALHNCNAYFLSPGSLDNPVDYRVEPVRDGKRISSRRVTGSQGSRQILDLLCSFQTDEKGVEHQVNDAPPVPGPEALVPERDFLASNAAHLPALAVAAYGRPFPVDIRLVDPESVFLEDRREPRRNYWFRMPSAADLSADWQHRCLLAFLSDYRLAGMALAPHVAATDVERIFAASLNHSLWIHRSVRADEWLLFAIESPWAGGGRGMVRAAIYNHSGQLVASIMQEAVIGLRS